MHILMYGAGVIGSVYASRLVDAGHRVTIVARGQRLEELRGHGLVTEDIASGNTTKATVDVVDAPASSEVFDLAIIALRGDQVSAEAIAPVAATSVPTVLLFFNTANPHQYAALFPDKQVLLGFPGVAGERKDGVVSYLVVKAQPTTLGEMAGPPSAALRSIVEALTAGGLPTTISASMIGWLQYHAVFVSCILAAIYASTLR